MKTSCFLTSALLAATFFPFPLNGQEPPRALEPLESPNDPFAPVSVPSPVPVPNGGSASRSTGGVPASACQVPPGKDDTCPVCLSGYVGDGCATCAPGFEFSDGGGECLAGFIAPVESSSSGSGSASSEPTSSESGSASSVPDSSASSESSSVPDSSASSESSSTATDPRAAAPVFLASAMKKKRAVHVISAGSSTGGASSPGSSASSSPVIVLPSPIPPGPPASGNTSSSTGSGSGSASDNTASGSEDSAGSALIGRCCVPLAAADPGKNGGNDGSRDGRHIAAEITAYATAGCLVVLFMLFIVMNSRLARTIAEVRAARAAPDSRGNGDASHYQPLHV